MLKKRCLSSVLSPYPSPFCITVQDFRKGTHGPHQCVARTVHPAPTLDDRPSGWACWAVHGFQQHQSLSYRDSSTVQTPTPLCRNLAWAGAGHIGRLCPQPRKGKQGAQPGECPAHLPSTVPQITPGNVAGDHFFTSFNRKPFEKTLVPCSPPQSEISGLP